jgi:hypothetical protein
MAPSADQQLGESVRFAAWGKPAFEGKDHALGPRRSLRGLAEFKHKVVGFADSLILGSVLVAERKG